jgi:hypothetical protein
LGRWSDEPEDGYWAEVPELPGCYSQGDTISDLLANVREAISGVPALVLGTGWTVEKYPVSMSGVRAGLHSNLAGRCWRF